MRFKIQTFSNTKLIIWELLPLLIFCLLKEVDLVPERLVTFPPLRKVVLSCPLWLLMTSDYCFLAWVPTPIPAADGCGPAVAPRVRTTLFLSNLLSTLWQCSQLRDSCSSREAGLGVSTPSLTFAVLLPSRIVGFQLPFGCQRRLWKCNEHFLFFSLLNLVLFLQTYPSPLSPSLRERCQTPKSVTCSNSPCSASSLNVSSLGLEELPQNAVFFP